MGNLLKETIGLAAEGTAATNYKCHDTHAGPRGGGTPRAKVVKGASALKLAMAPERLAPGEAGAIL